MSFIEPTYIWKQNYSISNHVGAVATHGESHSYNPISRARDVGMYLMHWIYVRFTFA